MQWWCDVLLKAYFTESVPCSCSFRPHPSVGLTCRSISVSCSEGRAVRPRLWQGEIALFLYLLMMFCFKFKEQQKKHLRTYFLHIDLLASLSLSCCIPKHFILGFIQKEGTEWQGASPYFLWFLTLEIFCFSCQLFLEGKTWELFVDKNKTNIIWMSWKRIETNIFFADSMVM